MFARITKLLGRKIYFKAGVNLKFAPKLSFLFFLMDENQLSDLDSKETVGSSRKKIKYAEEEPLLDSSDDEYTFNTEETEGYRLIAVKNLSTAVSNAHVCEKGEKFFFKSMSFSVLDYDLFPISYPLVLAFPR